MRDFTAIDMASEIAVVRAGCVSAFDGLERCLGDVHQALEDVGAQVSGLAVLLAGAGKGAQARAMIARSCMAMSDALAATRQALGQREAMAAMKTAIEVLDSITQQAKHLTAVSSITCVTARSTGAEALGHYVVSLRQMIDELAGATAKLTHGLGSIRLAHAAVLADIAKAETAVSRAIERINRPKAGSAPAEASHSRLHERFDTGAADLAEAAHCDTSALVTAIQFSDSLAQRLEHVEQISALGEGLDDATRGLAAAQLAALAADAEVTLDVLAKALARLAKAGSDAAAQLRTRDGMAVEALLDAQRSDLTEGTALQSLLAPGLAAAQAGADLIRVQIEAARAGYERLTETALGVNLSAINATLLTSRGGEARAAMSVLSESVRGSAHDCRDYTVRCSAAMEVLENAVAAAQFPAITEAAHQLGADLENCRTGLAAAEDDLQRLATLRDTASTAAATLVEAISRGERALARALPAIDRLHGVAAALKRESATPGEAADPTLMARCAAFYTMPREREIHAAFCGVPLEEPATRTQELGDIFF